MRQGVQDRRQATTGCGEKDAAEILIRKMLASVAPLDAIRSRVDLLLHRDRSTTSSEESVPPTPSSSRKMTFVDAAAALQEGAVPTNAQLIAFLERTQGALPTQDKLTKSGSSLVLDTRVLLEVLAAIVQERNTDEELQEFLWRTRGAAGQLGKDGLKFTWGKNAKSKGPETDANGVKKKASFKAKAQQAGSTIKSDATQAGRHLRNLVRLFLVQPELRHIAADLGFVLAEAVDMTASKTIDGARGQLGQAQSSTGTFQTVAQKALAQARLEKDGDTINQQGLASRVLQLSQTGEGISVNGNIKPLSATLLREQMTAMLKSGGLSIDTIKTELANGRTVPALEELRAQAQLAAASVAKNTDDLHAMQAEIRSGKIPSRVLDVLTPREEANGDMAHSDETVEIPQRPNGTATALQATDLADALQMLFVANKQVHLQPKKEVLLKLARDTGKDAQANLDAAFNEEVQQRLLKRSKKLIVDCQGQEKYRDAFLWAIGRIETLCKHVSRKATLPGTSIDTALSETSEPLIQLLENFAGGQELRPLLGIVRELALGAGGDEEIRDYWRDVDAHLRRCLLEEGFALTPEADKGIEDLVERFRKLRQDYKNSIAKLITGISGFFDGIRKDELIVKLLKAFGALLRDIGKDGWRKSSLWNDLRTHILPSLLEKFGTIPVPRIKYLHPDFDLIIENIAVDLKSFLPDTFDVRMTNDVHLDFHKIKESTHYHSLKIKIKGMSLRVHKLAFAFTWRKGITFHDKGIADLNVRDFGVSIYIDVPKDPGPHYFIVRKVKAKLSTLRIKVHKSNHRLLHSFADQLANSYLTKRVLRHFIAMGITIGLKQLDVALMARKLNQDNEEGKINLKELRRQMAELRDLLRKYHEQAGTLEIDFTRPDTGEKMGSLGSKKVLEAAEKSIEDSHAVRWIKRQVDATARKDIKRNRWRSNAFDLDGMDSDWPAEEAAALDTVLQAEEEAAGVEESTAAAVVRAKPEGPTDENTVQTAEKELESSVDNIKQERDSVQRPAGMESAAGKAAVSWNDDRAGQAKSLEKVVEKDLS